MDDEFCIPALMVIITMTPSHRAVIHPLIWLHYDLAFGPDKRWVKSYFIYTWSNRLYYLGHRNWFVMKNQPISVSETRTIHNCAHRDKRGTKARDGCENTWQRTPRWSAALCTDVQAVWSSWAMTIPHLAVGPLSLTTGQQLFFPASPPHLEQRWAGICVLPGINCIQQGKLNPRLKRRLPVG